MSGYVEAARVLRNEQIGADVWIMELYAPKQAKEAQVGQFCNVRVTDGTAPLLRRPISYADKAQSFAVHASYMSPDKVQ